MKIIVSFVSINACINQSAQGIISICFAMSSHFEKTFFFLFGISFFWREFKQWNCSDSKSNRWSSRCLLSLETVNAFFFRLSSEIGYSTIFFFSCYRSAPSFGELVSSVAKCSIEFCNQSFLYLTISPITMKMISRIHIYSANVSAQFFLSSLSFFFSLFCFVVVFFKPNSPWICDVDIFETKKQMHE